MLIQEFVLFSLGEKLRFCNRLYDAITVLFIQIGIIYRISIQDQIFIGPSLLGLHSIIVLLRHL